MILPTPVFSRRFLEEKVLDYYSGFCFFFVFKTLKLTKFHKISTVQNWGPWPSAILERRTRSLETLYITYKNEKNLQDLNITCIPKPSTKSF